MFALKPDKPSLRTLSYRDFWRKKRYYSSLSLKREAVLPFHSGRAHV